MATWRATNPLHLILLTAAALCVSSWAAEEGDNGGWRAAKPEKTIEAADAAQHVGETLVVHGIIADVHRFKGGSVVLDFGSKYPNQTFAVFIPRNLVDVTGDMHEYVGKEMVVEGTIELYKGKPEIKLEDAGQLRR